MEKKTCCICGKEIIGWGNNPRGAIDETDHIAEWGPYDECCDECNTKYVISGRITFMQAKKIVNDLTGETAEEMLDQLRSLHTEKVVSDDMYNFITANWDSLI